jgi:hypothetical protein
MEFLFTKQGLNNTQTIDLAQCLSAVNRRFYRQGMNYAVGSIEAYSFSAARVGIGIIPTTWVADNATTRAYIAWNAQRKEVLDEQPSMKSKWSDFKIFMDSDHVSAGVLGNLTPVDAVGTAYALGEWTASEIVFPVTGGSGGTGAANQQTMHVVGDNIPAGNFTVSKTSFSLIEAYANSRRTEQNPDPSTTGVSETTNPYATLSVPDSLFQDVAENILDNNDLAPYVMNDYPGGATQAPLIQYLDDLRLNNFGDAGQLSSDQTGPFVCPFGLLRLQFQNMEDDETVVIVLDLVPGSYKGVLAERGV